MTNDDFERISAGSEAAIRLAFILLSVVLDHVGRDPRIGASINEHLGRVEDDIPAPVADLLHTAATLVAERTGAIVPSRLRPN